MFRKIILFMTGLLISSGIQASSIADLARTCKGKNFKLIGFSNNRSSTVYLKFIENKTEQEDQGLRIITLESQKNIRVCTDYKMYSAYYNRPAKGRLPEVTEQKITANKYYTIGKRGVSSTASKKQAKIILERIQEDYLIEKNCGTSHCKKQVRTCSAEKKLVRFVNKSQETILWLKIYNGVLDKIMSKERGARGNILLFPDSSLVICTNYSDIKWNPRVKHGSLASVLDAFFKAKFHGAKDVKKRYQIAQYIKLKNKTTYQINPDSPKQTVNTRVADDLAAETYLLNHKSFTLIQK